MVSPEIDAALQQHDWTPDGEDLALQEKFDVDIRFSRSPLYRHLYRGLFQGDLRLYRRTSSLTGTSILSMYSDEHTFPVYSVDEWWSDRWEATTYGRDFDFSKPFFSQFGALYREVPKLAVYNERAENCEYSVNAGRAKDSYYCYRVYRSEHCYYSETVTSHNQYLCDCLRCYRSSWLYDCVHCQNCHHSTNLYNCENTRDSHFCIDCVGCSDCLFSHNLRHKSYCIFNQAYSQEQYQREKKKYLNGSFATRQKNLQQFRRVWEKTLWSATQQTNCEDCVGDSLRNCAHCYECYDCVRTSYSRYCWDFSPSKEASYCLDVTGGGIGELIFNAASNGGENYFLRMCYKCRVSSYLTYCWDCFNCDHCFGCTGLHHKSYCILNRQYSKSAYEAMVVQIERSMREKGTWGQFFPQTFSPFAYNQSLANQYVPLSKAEAETYGFPWKDERDVEKRKTTLPFLPDSIRDVSDDICSQTLICSETGKAYRLVKPELSFYQTMNLPLPRQGPDYRMRERRKLLRSRYLWPRVCAVSGEDITTSIPPTDLRTVVRQGIYLDRIY